jgi:hypothetical protein
MGISPNTVHTYRDRLYRKLGVGSFCQVIAIAFGSYVEGLAAESRGVREVLMPSNGLQEPSVARRSGVGLR